MPQAVDEQVEPPVRIVAEPILVAEALRRFLYQFTASDGWQYRTMSASTRAEANRAFLEKRDVRLEYTDDGSVYRNCWKVA